MGLKAYAIEFERGHGTGPIAHVFQHAGSIFTVPLVVEHPGGKSQ